MVSKSSSVKQILLFGISLSLLLTGCAAPASKKYVTVRHILKQVEDGESGYFAEYAASVADVDDASKADTYLTAGLALARSACYDSLDRLASRSNNSNFAQEELGVLVVLASGVLGVNDSNSKTFTRIALGTAAVNSTIDLYENYYLLGPDVDIIVAKIREAMEVVFSKVTETTPATFYDAYARLESYSRICGTYSVRAIVREAIKQASFDATSYVVDAVTDETLDKIAQLFGRVSLSNDQYFGLYWYTHQTPGTGSDEETALVTKLGDITLADAKTHGTAVKQLFRRIPRTQKKFQVELETIIERGDDPNYGAGKAGIVTRLDRLNDAGKNVVDPRYNGSGAVELIVR